MLGLLESLHGVFAASNAPTLILALLSNCVDFVALLKKKEFHLQRSIRRNSESLKLFHFISQLHGESKTMLVLCID